MSQTVTRKYQGSAFRKYTALLLMVVFGYLLEVCVMPYMRIFGVPGPESESDPRL